MDASTFEAEMHFETFLETFKPDGLESDGLQAWALPECTQNSLTEDIFNLNACADADISVLPGAANASGTTRTPAQRIEAIKVKNRRAQQRYREKKKAEEKALADNVEALNQQIASLKLQREASAGRARQLAERAFAASSQCVGVRCEMARLGSQQAMLPSTPEFAPRAAPQVQPESAACSTSESAGCSIFTTGPQYRHNATVSISKLESGYGSVALSFVSLQSQAAERLGCSPNEVSWQFESECFPDVTRGAPMTGHMGEADDISKQACLYFAHMTQMVSHLAVLHRLEALKAATAAAADSCAGGGDLPDMQPLPWHDPGPAVLESLLPARAGTSAQVFVAADVTPVSSYVRAANGALTQREEHWHQVFFRPSKGGSLLAVGPPRASNSIQAQPASQREQSSQASFAMEVAAPHDAVPESDAVKRAGFCATASSTASLCHSFFPSVLQRCVCRMHPADALRMCKTLRGMFGVAPSQPPDAGAGGPPGGPNSALAVVVTAFNEAVHAISRSVRCNPTIPLMPSSPEAIEQLLQQTRKELVASLTEWHLLYYVTMTCAPAKMRSIKMQVSTLEFAEAEAVNLEAYSTLKTDAEQQFRIAKEWADYQQIMAGLNAGRHAIARDLQQLPSTADMDLGDLYALRRPMHARIDLSLAAPGSLTGASASSSLSNLHFGSAMPSVHNNSVSASLPWTPLRGACLSSAPAVPAGMAGGSLAPVAPGASWMQRLLGVSADTTEAAAQALAKLRALQEIDNAEYNLYTDRFVAALTVEQFVRLTIGRMPDVPDLFCLAELMARERRRGRFLSYTNFGE